MSRGNGLDVRPAAGDRVGVRVLELWRYPVKSLQGERVEAADARADGLGGDRRWALFDLETGFGLTARRVPDLLCATGRVRPDGGCDVVLPDGTVTSDDAVISGWLGRPVTLRSADRPTRRRYENLDDAEDEGGRWHAYEGSGRSFHDTEAFAVSLVSTASLGAWDRRRFRANVVLDGEGEDALVGSRVRVGAAVLDVVAPVPRCVMTTRAQPGGIDRDTSVLRTIHRERGGVLSIGAGVVTAGRVAVGDELAEVR